MSVDIPNHNNLVHEHIDNLKMCRNSQHSPRTTNGHRLTVLLKAYALFLQEGFKVRPVPSHELHRGCPQLLVGVVSPKLLCQRMEQAVAGRGEDTDRKSRYGRWLQTLALAPQRTMLVAALPVEVLTASVLR